MLKNKVMISRFSESAIGPSAALSSVITSVTTIASDGVASAVISGVVKGVSNGVLSGVTVVISATGSGNTITQPAGITGADGSYSGTFKTTGASAHTISITANGILVAQTVVVTAQSANAPDAAFCTVATNDSILATDETATLTLTARDSSNNPITVGGATVTFAKASGTIGLSFGTVVDNGNGTYSCVVTCTSSSGTIGTMSSTINGANVTTTMPTIARPVPLFHSAWDTSTGTSSASLRDTNLATPWALPPTAVTDLEIVTAPGSSPGFTNALRVSRYTGAAGNKWCQIQDLWALPDVGKSLFFRQYIYVDMATLSNTESSHHPTESAYSGSWTSGYTLKMQPNGDGTFRLRLQLAPGYFTKSDSVGVRDPLTNAQWYRLEWQLLRTATDTYTVLFRIYDNIPSLWGDPTVNIRRYTNPAYPIMNTVNTGIAMTDAEVRKFRVGSNGGTWANASAEYYYWGGVCVRSDDWCGPYNSSDK